MKLALFLILLAQNSFASIWEDTNSWNLQYEEDFSNWIKGASVREDIFKNKSSPYFGINTDCADTSYALRAIFAFENSLPFAIKDPTANRLSKTFNNQTTRYDRLKTPQQKLIQMINDLGESVGTENLAYFDSYPLAISAVTPGSLYMYKIKAHDGNFIRHSYNIKNITEVGTFDMIYSTQANKKLELPLLYKKGMDLSYAPSAAPWGFKRIRWPLHITRPLSEINQELGVSSEQYELVKNLGESKFFKFVKKSLATSTELPTDRVERLYQNLCKEVQARVEYVNQAVQYLAKTDNKCMNYEDYDAFSTPARDHAIKEGFDRLIEAINELEKSDEKPLLLSQNLAAAYSVVGKGKQESCMIKYGPRHQLSLKVYKERMDNKLISSHPNDSLLARWGGAKSQTKCKAWY